MSEDWSDSDDVYRITEMQSSRIQGWGSCESRRAYTSLSTLANDSMDYEYKISKPSKNVVFDRDIAPVSQENAESNPWGFFVDSIESS